MVQKSLPFVCTLFLCFLAPSSAWTQGETCLPLQDCGYLKVEMLRATNTGGFTDCAGNSGCGKVYYKVFLRYSGPQTNAFTLPYAHLNINVNFNSSNGTSYIDVQSSKNCFKNAGKWTNEIFHVSPVTAGIDLTVGENLPSATTCQDNKKKVVFEPGAPYGSSTCPNLGNGCLYVELFTLVVNGVSGDAISLSLGKTLFTSDNITCSTIDLQNGGANDAVNSYTVPPLPLPAANSSTNALVLETYLNNGNQSTVDFGIKLHNNGNTNITSANIAFSVDVNSSSALETPFPRISYGGSGIATPTYVYKYQNDPKKYRLGYVLSGISISNNSIKELALIRVDAPQPNNQTWWSEITLISGTTRIEVSGECTTFNISSTLHTAVYYHAGDPFCDASTIPIDFFVREADECLSGLEIGIKVGKEVEIEKVEFKIMFNLKTGSQLGSGLKTDHWINCTDCITSSSITNNELHVLMGTSDGAVALLNAGEYYVGIDVNNQSFAECVRANLMVLSVKIRNSDTCIPSTISLNELCPPKVAGLIVTESLTGVSKVFVDIEPNDMPAVAGCNIQTPQTTSSGRYGTCFPDCPTGITYTVTPMRDDFPLNGITLSDFNLMAKHIVGLQILNSPYKRIAADVNKSGSITTLDIAALRRLFLGIDEELANNNSWRFIDKDYTFPNPSNPFNQPFPETKVVYANQAADFIGVKIGDVDNTAQPKNDTAVQVEWSKPLHMGTNMVAVPVRYAGHTPVECLQLGFRFDPAQMSLTATLPGDLPGWNKDCFGLKFAERGEIRTLWLPMQPMQENPIKPGMLLFSLVFRAKQPLPESGVPIRLDNAVLENLALTSGYTLYPVQKVTNIAQHNRMSVLEKEMHHLKVTCSPNPVYSILHFMIENETEEPGKVALFNALGQRVFVRDISLIEGHQTLSFSEVAALPRGIYIWKVYGQHEKVQGTVLLE